MENQTKEAAPTASTKENGEKWKEDCERVNWIGNRYFSRSQKRWMPIPIPKDEGEPAQIHQVEKISPREDVMRVPERGDFPEPIITVDEGIRIFKVYEVAKTKLLTDRDILWIGKDGKPTEKGKGTPHIRRSGWRKLSRFFGISVQIVEMKKEYSRDEEGEYYLWRCVARASRGNCFQDAEGVATSRDPFFSRKHGKRIEPNEANIVMKAQTVAFNRAISDFLGGSEISAEEVEE